VRYSSRSREEANRYVENIREGGSTNINDAVKAALGQIPDGSRPSYVLFLTDGLPTAGETNEMAIAENSRRANGHRARLFAFGVGFDVNARLLDRLSGGNSGTSTYVKPDEDIETNVARFYAKLTSPVLADIRIEFEGTDVNRVYPRDIPDLFEGGQLIVAGRYRDSGPTTLRLSGRVGDELRRFTFPVELARAGGGSSYDFVERLWAVRRVGFIIDQIDLHGRSKELTDELVGLSSRYGILTPYTSFLADERVPLHARAANAARAEVSLRELEETTGGAGVGQRAVKQSLLDAQRDQFAAGTAPPLVAGANAGGVTKYGRALGRAPASAAPRGFGMMAPGPAAQPAQVNTPGLAVAFKDVQNRDGVAETVRQLGTKTFYYKDNAWLDTAVSAEEATRAVVLEQFSDAFFTLARSQSAEQNQYLTFNEPVTVKLNDRVYRIEPRHGEGKP
jgi:Ca-activated chloride channel family protein